MRLRAFFKYFGGKHLAVDRYPAPLKNARIVEPFAGSAAYATRWHQHDVLLIDADPTIAAVWQYLIAVRSSEIRALPVFSSASQVHIDELGNLCPEAKALIGLWLFSGSSHPRDKRSSWARNPEYSDRFWGAQIRERLASQVDQIRHWKAMQGDYSAAPDAKATWFVDPPYEQAGHVYRCSSKSIDYGRLAQWCQQRKGQTVVCENVGATWLPFERAYDGQANAAKASRVSREAVWIMQSEEEKEEETFQPDAQSPRQRLEIVRKKLAEIEEYKAEIQKLEDELCDMLTPRRGRPRKVEAA